MSTRRPSLPPMPDLSHLSEEERAIIEGVIQRQKEEEDKEQEILRSLQDDFNKFQENIKKNAEDLSQFGSNLGAVCEICHKTKFADGVGHKCHYCSQRSCARCGGKINPKTNKAVTYTTREIPGTTIVWACNLCRKKQELLIKTGQWYHGGQAKPVNMDNLDKVGSGSDTMSVTSTHSQQTSPTSSDSRMPQNGGGEGSMGKLYGNLTDSGASSEKENMGHNRQDHRREPHTGSVHGKEFKRQYSLSEMSAQNERTSDPRNLDHDHDRGRPPDRGIRDRKSPSEPRRRDIPIGAHGRGDRDRSSTRYDAPPYDSEQYPDQRYHDPSDPRSRDSSRSHDMSHDRHHHGDPRYGGDGSERDERRHDDPRYRDNREDRQSDRYREREAEIDRRYREDRPLDRRREGHSSQERLFEESDGRRSRDSSVRRRAGRDPDRPQENKEGDIYKRGHYREPGNVESHRPPNGERGGVGEKPSGYNTRHVTSKPPLSPKNQKIKDAEDHRMETRDNLGDLDSVPDSVRRQHLDPSSAVNPSNATKTRRKVDMLRNDSLSSDPSDCVRPPPPKPHKHKKGKTKLRQLSFSSSEDEIQSTPDCTSCEDQEIESESVSEKDIYNQGRSPHADITCGQNWKKDEILAAKIKKFLAVGELETGTTENNQLSEAKRKMVRFGCGEGRSMEEDTGWSEPTVKDSGIDTGLSSSNQTLNDDWLKHPVTWQPSADGTKLIGHMILKKGIPDAKDPSVANRGGTLGLKVIGGKPTENGQLGAFITKVKKGSIADSVGHLRPGDEVLEWNGRSLQGASFEEVYDIILESKQEPQVELIVQRDIGKDLQPGMTDHPDNNRGDHPWKLDINRKHPRSGRSDRPSVTVTSPGSPGPGKTRAHSPNVAGKLQVKLCYDGPNYQLIVTILRAEDLPHLHPHQPSNLFCKLYLLPDRSEKSRRKTKGISETTNPRWHQSFIYSPINNNELLQRILEITVWNYDRNLGGEYLGEVVIDLSTADVNDQAYWYQLSYADKPYEAADRTRGRRGAREAYNKNQSSHLSPQGSAPRLSDSDMSEFEEGVGVVSGQGVVGRGDGASVSSIGSSPPPPNDDLEGGRSRRRDRMPSPMPRRRGQSVGCVDEYDGERKHLLAPQDAGKRKQRSPSHDPGSDRIRSRSPGRHRDLDVRSLSPPDSRSRSRTQSPTRSTPSPKKRQLPQIPVQSQSKDKVTQDLEDRARKMKLRMKMNAYKHAASGGPASDSETGRDRERVPHGAHNRFGSQGRLDSGSRERLDMQGSRDRLDMQGSRDPLDIRGSRDPLNVRGSRDPLDSRISRDRLDRKSQLRDRDRDRFSDRELKRIERARDGDHRRGREVERGDLDRRRRHKEFSPEVQSDNAFESDASEASDMSEVSKISTISVRSTQSERPRSSRKFSEFTSKMESRGPNPKPKPLNRSLSNSDVYEKNDGSMSDSAVSSTITTDRRKRRPSLGYKVAALVGLSRKSSSTSQLGQTEGGKKPKSTFQRSEEVGAAADMRNRITRQTSKDSTDGSIGSLSSDTSTNAMWLPSAMRLAPEGQFGDFIEGLGPAQLVGRQVLGSPCLGEIQLALYDRKGHLEVEVIRARGLISKPGAKILPAPYVKVYLMEGKTCVEKQKTTIVRRTLDPLYQQQLVFMESYVGKILQVTVWGDYGRMDRKVFMGVSQILLEDLDLSNIVFGWYKLFSSSSLVGHHGQSGGQGQGHVRRPSDSSLEGSYSGSFNKS
ncbi:unnamed protein product [Owenia fusiformis]|uniref:Regulating synaptic membrane exocytosis protein 2-like n=1 Tax=Owenia fusiformis TaxID=6347 RepID=A0A8S4N1B1_OWEFU|nr:unnamed protein product [Owenia fusiformis]